MLLGLLIGYDLTEAFRDGWSNASSGILANHNLLIDSKGGEYTLIVCGAVLFWIFSTTGNRYGLFSSALRMRLWFWLAYLPLALFSAIDIGIGITWPEAVFILVLVMLTVAPALSFLLTFVFIRTDGRPINQAKT